MEDFVLKKGRKGTGVYANRDFRKGEFVMKLGGKAYRRKDNPKGFDSPKSYYLQVGVDRFLGPTKTADNFLNHSCRPSCAVNAGRSPFLFAIKGIKKGDEINFDYSTTMCKDEWEMECICGSRGCRKKVVSFEKLPVGVQKRCVRMGIVPAYNVKRMKVR